MLDWIAASMRQADAGLERAEPKYRILYNHLLRAIEGGRWKVGHRIPPESEFARRMPVSLGTIQKALKLLEEDGVVIRRLGHGTFVAVPPANEADIRNFRFLDDEAGGERLLPVYPKVLSVERSQAGGPWASFLGAGPYVRIARIISVNLEFTTFAELFLPAERFGAFLDYKPRQLDGVSVTHLLAAEFNAPALKIAQRFGIAPISAAVAGQIGVAPGTTGIEWEHRAHTYRATPLYYQRVTVPPNHRKIEIWDSIQEGEK